MNFALINELNDAQIQDLHEMYQHEWWTEGREPEEIKKMLAHSDLVIAFCDSETQQLIAFSRVLTDFIYKAVVFDVIIRKSHRRKSLGTKLMDKILQHPALKHVQHFELYCLPKHLPFYRKFHFSEDLGELCFLRRRNDDPEEQP